MKINGFVFYLGKFLANAVARTQRERKIGVVLNTFISNEKMSVHKTLINILFDKIVIYELLFVVGSFRKRSGLNSNGLLKFLLMRPVTNEDSQ